jgi:superfamily II DNA or RNA helicase
MPEWAGTDSAICRVVTEQSDRCLRAYAVNPILIQEHAAIERATRQGGYGRRQLFELVQNGADAIRPSTEGRIEVLLTRGALYCANEGDPIDAEGVEAILSSHLNVKKANEIGRFGIGFKSVLAVSESPELFSRSGSFRFDAPSARARITAVHPGSTEVPTLRTAEPVDPVEEARLDGDLGEMMSWASTIVRLRRRKSAASWLSDDIASFPAEFLLFSPQVAELDLEARSEGRRRELRVVRTKRGVRLLADGRDELWWTASTRHQPSEAVLEDAGVLAERGELPLVWAVEREAKVTRGRFWSFFPTETITTLSGILNAPWKTNEDRQNLLPGPFNDEFIETAAHLVVDHLSDLVVDSDPARHLDLLPSRDSYNHADALLGQLVFDLARDRACVPDQTGKPQVPDTLWLHPSGLPARALALWAEYSGRPVDWCHSDVETFNRRPRVERLLPDGRVASVTAWLEALVRDGSAEASKAAIRVAAAVNEETTTARRREIQAARFVLTDQGTMAAPASVMIWLAGRPRSARNSYVEQALVTDPAIRQALMGLGIRESDALGDFRAFLSRLRADPVREDWSVLWTLAARVSPTELSQALGASGRLATEIGVMTVSGEFVPARLVLLPGDVVSAGGGDDAAVTVDVDYHHETLAHLRRIGVAEGPGVALGSSTESWFGDYLRSARTAYRQKLDENKSNAKPHADLVTFEELVRGGGHFTGPLEALSVLSESGRARLTSAVLAAGSASAFWTLTHETNPGKYPKLRYPSPVAWRLRREGRLTTSLGIMPVKKAVGPQLEALRELLAVADCAPEAAATLRLASNPKEVSAALWMEAVDRADECEDDPTLGALVMASVQRGIVPTSIRCRVGATFENRPPGDVTVTDDPEELSKLVPHAVPVLLAPSTEAAAALISTIGMRPASDSVRFEVDAVPLRDAVPIVDEFPALRLYMHDAHLGLLLARCTELREGIVTSLGTTYTDRDYIRDEARIWWHDSLGDEALLRRMRDDLSLPITEDDCRTLATRRADAAREQVLKAVRAEPDMFARLARAVGIDALRRRLPTGLISVVEDQAGALRPEDAARIAYSLFGPEVLKEFRAELAEGGLEPPTMWAGTDQARRFVRDLGFPVQFAGAEHQRLDPLLEVLGPPDLPPLHLYQEQISAAVRDVASARDRNRGLVALPTGAGKTRIVVEALIRSMVEVPFEGPVLWVAETEELCEQAVQAWAYVWRAQGSTTPLFVSRLWASNEAAVVDKGHQVVVGTVAKLSNCIDDPEYRWLSQPAVVIIDEAHGAIAPVYTRLLAWLGISLDRNGPPLIGMTATPYRGRSEDETARLVTRFYGHRLDEGVLGEDQYATLQQMGVLAQVRHQEITGSEITLTQDELAMLQRTKLMPQTAGARVGADPKRNQVLLESIRALPADWTVLLFAASVEHAQLMAALLTLEGISAAAVSGGTPTSSRRHFIEEFRAGRIRVLTNYAVLTEGFDAPAIRAVYVARPTYSPNLYQQMIGRGLRGPLNGGKEECLIVNVRDNVAQFGEALAFTQFEYLWRAEGDPSLVG